MSGRVAIVAPLAPAFYAQLKERFDPVALPQDRSRWSDFVAQLDDEIEVAVTSAFSGLAATDMDKLPHLRAIANFGVGYDTTDVDAASARGILVSNTPDILNDAVADLAVGLMIDVVRRVSAADRFARAGHWEDGQFPLARQDVTGRRVGIVGLGRIGQEIANRLHGFRCEVAYHNRREVAGSQLRYFDSLIDLAAWCEVLVVAVPGGAVTNGLVDGRVLAALGVDGYLVNIARGSVIDEEELIRALRGGVIAGAGLDVFTHEPHIPAALRDENLNVVLAPHIGTATVETRQKMADLTMANIASWLDQRTLVTPVNG